MAILIGLLSGAVFFVGMGAAFYAGIKIGSRVTPQKEENDRAAQLQKQFADMFNYDIHKALERKKVI